VGVLGFNKLMVPAGMEPAIACRSPSTSDLLPTRSPAGRWTRFNRARRRTAARVLQMPGMRQARSRKVLKQVLSATILPT
jgi:hypothetical protein